MKIATEGKINEVSFMWPGPGADTTPVQKVFVTQAGDQVCGVGYYNNGASYIGAALSPGAALRRQIQPANERLPRGSPHGRADGRDNEGGDGAHLSPIRTTP
jgi:hypothetical protein